MRKIPYLLMIALVVTPVINAQIHLYLEEQEVQIDDGRQHGWVMPVVGDLDEALKDLDNFCKERTKVKMKKDGENLMIAEKVSLLSIVAKRGDLIGYAFNGPTNNALALVFRMGYDISLNSVEYESEMEKFRNYARQFMAFHYEQVYARKLDDIDKKMKDLEKDRGQAEKQIGNLNKKIENNNDKIEKETDESKITALKSEITTLGADKEILSASLPQLTAKLEELQTQKDQLSTEAHTYLGTIGSL